MTYTRVWRVQSCLANHSIKHTHLISRPLTELITVSATNIIIQRLNEIAFIFIESDLILFRTSVTLPLVDFGSRFGFITQLSILTGILLI